MDRVVTLLGRTGMTYCFREFLQSSQEIKNYMMREGGSGLIL
jgi:hypothetical protein